MSKYFHRDPLDVFHEGATKKPFWGYAFSTYAKFSKKLTLRNVSFSENSAYVLNEWSLSHPTSICSNSTMETPKQCLESVQSSYKDTRTTTMTLFTHYSVTFVDFEQVNTGWVNINLLLYKIFQPALSRIFCGDIMED